MNRTDSKKYLAAASYLFFYISAIAVLLLERKDTFVRFHAWQSLFLFGGIFVLNLVVNYLFSFLGFFEFIGNIASSIIILFALAFWVISMIRCARGVVFYWPLVGKWAAGQVGEVHDLRKS